MAQIPTPILDYSNKDFDSIRARLFNLISSVFPEWTSQSVSDFGNILVDLFAFVGDVLGFYLDNHALESKISTATQRRSLVSLAKLLNFTPSGATAATADCLITLASVPSNDVTFPAGTIARTLAVTNPVEFQLLSDAVIPSATNPPQITTTVENSKTFQEVFPVTGLASQQVTLGETPFLDNTETVSAGNGAYTKVDNFLDSTSTDRHYTVAVDQNNRARITFGDGTLGELPTGTITVSYRTGGGSAGNVEAGTIQRLVGSFTDAVGTTVIPSITNALAATGGGPRDGIETIRQEAPQSLRVLNRTVSREDYEINARRVPGVARALMLTSNEDPRVAENAGNLYVLPTGGGQPSTALIDLVNTEVTVTFPNTLTFSVSVSGPVYDTVNVETTVFFSSTATKATAAAQIRTNLAAYFAPTLTDGSENPNVNFGYYYQAAGQGADASVPFSDIFNVIRDTTGVYKIRDQNGLFLNGVARDVAIGVDRFPELGTVTIVDGDTGTAV